ELNAPSAKSRRKRFGSRNATTNASATGPVPSAAARNMSLTKPRMRLEKVAPPTVVKFLRSDIQPAFPLPLVGRGQGWGPRGKRGSTKNPTVELVSAEDSSASLATRP